MKTFELLQEAEYSDEYRRLTGTRAEWIDAFGATKKDIRQAHALAKELPSYKKLLKVTKDISTERHTQFGSFAFEHPIKFDRSHGTSARGKAIVVHFQGQVRGTTEDPNTHPGGYSQYPYRMPPPPKEIDKSNPVQSILDRYDHAFKYVLTLLPRAARLGAAYAFAAKIRKILVKYGYAGHWDSNVAAVGPQRIAVFPQNVSSLVSQYLKRSPGDLLSAIYDGDDDTAADIKGRVSSGQMKLRSLIKSIRIHEKQQELLDIADDLKEELDRLDFEVKMTIRNLRKNEIQRLSAVSFESNVDLKHEVTELLKIPKVIVLNFSDKKNFEEVLRKFKEVE